MEAPEAFTPTLPVSVIIPYDQTPAETLAMTLAALEGLRRFHRWRLSTAADITGKMFYPKIGEALRQ